MRLMVNVTPAVNLPTGIGRYVRSLYRELMREKELQIFAFDGRSATREIPPPRRGGRWVIDVLWRLPWPLVLMLRSIRQKIFEWNLRRLLLREKVKLYHETTFFPAAVHDVRQVLTIYDLSLLTMPHYHPRERVAYFRLFFSRRLSRLDHVITISTYIRDEVLRTLPLEPHRVTAIPLAASPVFFPRTEKTVKSVVERYGIQSPFVLAVGTLDPRKNLSLIFRALPLVWRSPLSVVVVGWEGWGHRELRSHLRSAGTSCAIRFLGYLPDDDLAALYSGASCLVYPSLYEGFGLPVLEAMSCGCPVICSNRASLPEVAGDAAWFISPDDPYQLAEALERLLADKKERLRMVEQGLRRARMFSWQATAEKTLAVFKSLLGV